MGAGAGVILSDGGEIVNHARSAPVMSGGLSRV